MSRKRIYIETLLTAADGRAAAAAPGSSRHSIKQAPDLSGTESGVCRVYWLCAMRNPIADLLMFAGIGAVKHR